MSKKFNTNMPLIPREAKKDLVVPVAKGLIEILAKVYGPLSGSVLGINEVNCVSPIRDGHTVLNSIKFSDSAVGNALVNIINNETHYITDTNGQNNSKDGSTSLILLSLLLTINNIQGQTGKLRKQLAKKTLDDVVSSTFKVISKALLEKQTVQVCDENGVITEEGKQLILDVAATTANGDLQIIDSVRKLVDTLIKNNFDFKNTDSPSFPVNAHDTSSVDKIEFEPVLGINLNAKQFIKDHKNGTLGKTVIMRNEKRRIIRFVGYMDEKFELLTRDYISYILRLEANKFLDMQRENPELEPPILLLTNNSNLITRVITQTKEFIASHMGVEIPVLYTTYGNELSDEEDKISDGLFAQCTYDFNKVTAIADSIDKWRSIVLSDKLVNEATTTDLDETPAVKTELMNIAIENFTNLYSTIGSNKEINTFDLDTIRAILNDVSIKFLYTLYGDFKFLQTRLENNLTGKELEATMSTLDMIDKNRAKSKEEFLNTLFSIYNMAMFGGNSNTDLLATRRNITYNLKEINSTNIRSTKILSDVGFILNVDEKETEFVVTFTGANLYCVPVGDVNKVNYSKSIAMLKEEFKISSAVRQEELHRIIRKLSAYQIVINIHSTSPDMKTSLNLLSDDVAGAVMSTKDGITGGSNTAALKLFFNENTFLEDITADVCSLIDYSDEKKEVVVEYVRAFINTIRDSYTQLYTILMKQYSDVDTILEKGAILSGDLAYCKDFKEGLVSDEISPVMDNLIFLKSAKPLITMNMISGKPTSKVVEPVRTTLDVLHRSIKISDIINGMEGLHLHSVHAASLIYDIVKLNENKSEEEKSEFDPV